MKTLITWRNNKEAICMHINDVEISIWRNKYVTLDGSSHVQRFETEDQKKIIFETMEGVLMMFGFVYCGSFDYAKKENHDDQEND